MTASPQSFSDASKTAEHHLLAAILAEPGIIVLARQTVRPEYFPREHKAERAVARAMWDCIEGDVPVEPTLANIEDRLNLTGQAKYVSDGYWEELTRLGRTSIINAWQANATIIRQKHERRQLVRLLQNAQEGLSTTSDETLGQFTGTLSQEMFSIVQAREEELPADSGSIYERMNEAPEPAIPTGLLWFDRTMRGGWHRRRIMGVQGAPKNRKTTLWQNWVVHGLFAGLNIDVFTVDDDAPTILLQLESMIATLLMREHRIDPHFWSLDGDFLRMYSDAPNAMNDIFTAEQLPAIQQARSIMRGFASQLRIYDTSTYPADDFGWIEQKLRLDKQLYGCNFYVYDFLQDLQIAGSGSYFEKWTKLIRELKRLTNQLDMIAIWVSQLNESYLKGMAGRSTGSEGGGAFPRAVQTLVETERIDDLHFKASILLGRRTGTGTVTYWVNPSSGVILNPQIITSED